ncbi:hypothetical protein F5B22DRAFT_651833 [Xylaria bambusicola]|uniref:uncharacterized protein n=1 Tax=Xylaria bambusicola TaxID=326684 RepID=UPI002007ABDA|nr:uncharacterized protein F5B22DRAFT_651833 [Xylaria bambusicola]KAI0505327.1 hypothetical protein F5B22DRAFT_651833 [Xylaria bambusicola]
MAQSSKLPFDIHPALIPWSREDVLQGISDTRERRKLQNRINQRARRTRRRQVAAKATPGDSIHADVIQADLPLLLRRDQTTRIPQVDFRKLWHAIETHDPRFWENEPYIRAFKDFMYTNWLARAPRPALLHSLVQFNFVHALLANAAVLGITASQLGGAGISHFYVVRPLPPGVDSKVNELPSGLQPTELQRQTSHHPWFDLLPLPQMRDNLLRHGVEDLDEDSLCCTMGGFEECRESGFIIWGSSWDVSSWEVTEDFVRSSWGWIINGCWELRQSTNNWRAKRGEPPLFLPTAEVNSDRHES